MLAQDAEEQLTHFASTSFPKSISEIVPGKIFYVAGYGHSNATFIIAEHSVILIDTLDTDVRAEGLKAIIAEHTDKPVGTIIFTHGHTDHTGGSGAFTDLEPEIIAYAPAAPVLRRTETLADIFRLRATRQFGYELSQEELITQGLGPREGSIVGEGKRNTLAPTTIYRNEQVERVIDGVRLVLGPAQGETDDTLFVWIPDHKVLCCGDNYYGCWPNLYAIRGGQYRDVAAWVDSLEKLQSLEASVLLPGHMKPILGAETVHEVLGNYREAIDFVLSETLSCMGKGLTVEEATARVMLPDSLLALPYLGEYYGTVVWSVRSIYTGYFGWFDGNPTQLNPLPLAVRAEKTIEPAGGFRQVESTIREALASGDFQWAMELADLLLVLDPASEMARNAKSDGMMGLAKLETSSNGRHYYISSAKALRDRPT